MNYLVKAVRDYAVDNIDKDDWDLIVHYFTDEDIEKLIAGSQRTYQTNKQVLKIRAINAARLAVHKEVRANKAASRARVEGDAFARARLGLPNPMCLPVNELPEVSKK